MSSFLTRSPSLVTRYFPLVTHHSLLSFASGILLTLSFPKFSLGFLAWFALIPLLLAVFSCGSRRDAALCGLIAGAVFFGLSLSWLNYVTVFGWLFVTLLETAFLVLFSLTVYEARSFRFPMMTAVWVALAWTANEIFRSEIPVFGFGWNLLAYSQSDYAWIRQSADTVGAYGLGCVMAFVNGCLFQLIQKNSKSEIRNSKQIQNSKFEFSKPVFGFSVIRIPDLFRILRLEFRIFPLVLSVLLTFILLLSYGYFHSRRTSPSRGVLRISLIQGNIPQDIKWEPAARGKILEVYAKLTELASYDSPHLIFWPEAAFPGYFNQDAEAVKVQELVRTLAAPLVVGSPHLEPDNTAYNSAYLLGPDGNVKSRYDKILLVPFGEFVPLQPVFGWLEPLAYTLGVSDFSAGSEPTVFELENGDLRFSVLICFENIFPNLVRSFTYRGAEFLAVMTNDAWFGNSAAPYQHVQASVFRAVENGVPLVHVANTGVSAFISRKGEVLGRVQSPEGKDIFVAGRKTYPLAMESESTLYRRGGWIFPYGALAAFVIMLAVKEIRSFILQKKLK